MADEASVIPWDVEEIPDVDRLFKRIHRNLFKSDRTVMTGAFSHYEMSVDWSKYSTPEESRRRANSPDDNAIVEMVAFNVRAIPDQQVLHRPVADNRSHSAVDGRKSEKVRVLLRRCCRIALSLSAE